MNLNFLGNNVALQQIPPIRVQLTTMFITPGWLQMDTSAPVQMVLEEEVREFSHTLINIQNQWWRVNLGQVYMVYKVVMWGRMDQGNRKLILFILALAKGYRHVYVCISAQNNNINKIKKSLMNLMNIINSMISGDTVAILAPVCLGSNHVCRKWSSHFLCLHS